MLGAVNASDEPDPYLRREDDVLVLGAAREDRIARGLLFAFGLAPALMILTWLAIGLLGLGSIGIALAVGAILSAIAMGLGVAGLVMLVRAEHRPRVRIDLGERLLHRPGASPEVLREPDAVVLSRRGLGWRLSLDRTVLVDRVPYTRGRAIARTARRVAEALEVAVDVPRAAERAPVLLPESADARAALVYAPIDVVIIGLGLYLAMTARDPKARFAARQSLVLLALEGALFGAILVVLGGPVLLLADHLPGVIAVGALACPLLSLALVRVAVRVLASLRARRGVVWVMPWLAPITRRWAPLEPKRVVASPAAPKRPARAARTPPREPAKPTHVGPGPWWP